MEIAEALKNLSTPPIFFTSNSLSEKQSISLFNNFEFNGFEPRNVLLQGSAGDDFSCKDNLFQLGILPRVVKINNTVMIKIFKNIGFAF